jgi:hypothetical protein
MSRACMEAIAGTSRRRSQAPDRPHGLLGPVASTLASPRGRRQAFDRDVVSHSLGIEQYAVKVGQSGNSSSEANIGNHLPDQAGKQWLVIFGDALCIGQENDRAWVCHRPVFPFGHRS